ncbi:ABC transporter substrate-binding protein [Halomonas ramblicola]|uniref:ABC transporter substrate-binding protein n=1 Tax=Halomonas ramblicola TaxID=747349 RepID=UPI0025B44F4A|nr:ABC transporter substrate-binding protein [Halomonas ramblicola]MDN3522219.1 ABC transporter substrate-binding protein [Halomonas ramblicola]
MIYSLPIMLKQRVLLLVLIAAASLSSSPVLGQKDREEGYIVTLDFAIAETLFEFSDLLVAMGGENNYRSWLGEGSTPSSLVNIGINPYPNKELIFSMDVKGVLSPPQYTRLEEGLSKIAPVEQLSPYRESSLMGWDRMVEFTKEVGLFAGREQEAFQLISQADEHMSNLRETISAFPDPLLIIQFLDERHVRVYGHNSLPGTVIDRIDLDNAWDGPTNRWGFSVISIDDLFKIHAYFVVVDTSHLSSRRAVQEDVMKSELWSLLPSVQTGNTTLLDANFWVFGAIPSAMRFAESLVEVLSADDARPLSRR